MEENIVEQEKFIWFDTKSNSDLFAKHLTSDNRRILFSGSFGTGKTTFLNGYFENKLKYNVVRISPVNYSVPDNKDVCDLIKYDVLCELLVNGFALPEGEKYSLGEKIWINRETLMHNIIEMIPKVGKSINNVAKGLSNIHKALKDTDKGCLEATYDFISDFESKSFMLAQDSISIIISEILAETKRKDGSKTVLIIDDIDRLDPEHVFRLFNVFASQVDNTGMLCDFDHVIFVCDIENVKKIYFHKYGEGVDFGGYIDKFCSKDVFCFSCWKEIERNLNNDIHNWMIGISNDSWFCGFVDSIMALLKLLFKHNIINFRDIHYFLEILSEEHSSIRPSFYYSDSDSSFFIRNLCTKGFGQRIVSKIRKEHEEIEKTFVPDDSLYLLMAQFMYLGTDFYKKVSYKLKFRTS